MPFAAVFRCIAGVGKAIVFALPVGCPARPTATGGPVSPAVGPVLPGAALRWTLARHLESTAKKFAACALEHRGRTACPRKHGAPLRARPALTLGCEVNGPHPKELLLERARVRWRIESNFLQAIYADNGDFGPTRILS